jgi:hypothetical protein
MHAVGQTLASAFQAIRSLEGERSPIKYSREIRDQIRSFERSN